MAVDSELLRQAMRSWATGVTIVTAKHEERIHGMTVSSFTSVSLNPPLVLISIQEQTRTFSLIRASGYFAVTVLSEDQQDVSNRFANPKTETEYRFGSIETRIMVTGVPLIKMGLAHFDCQVVGEYRASTHTIFIGEVLAVDVKINSEPLLYYNQGYRKLLH